MDKKITATAAIADKCIIAGTPASSGTIKQLLAAHNYQLGQDGYTIQAITFNGKRLTVIAAYTHIGVLYGSFASLQLLQTHQPIAYLKFNTVFLTIGII